MSLLNTIKGWTKGNQLARAAAMPGQVLPFTDLEAPLVAGPQGAALLQAARRDAVASDARAGQQTEGPDTSIISEAVPTDMEGMSDTQGVAQTAAADAGGLPLIGRRPVAEQQRILGAVVLAGVAGLLVMTFSSLNSAGKSAAQVGASGQALMQSQRLAKSVSQAVVGSPKAFPEVRESSEVLSRTVLGLRDGDAEIAAAPRSVQEALEPLVPLVERAAKNAAVVLAQDFVQRETVM